MSLPLSHPARASAARRRLRSRLRWKLYLRERRRSSQCTTLKDIPLSKSDRHSGSSLQPFEFTFTARGSASRRCSSHDKHARRRANRACRVCCVAAAGSGDAASRSMASDSISAQRSTSSAPPPRAMGDDRRCMSPAFHWRQHTRLENCELQQSTFTRRNGACRCDSNAARPC
jgi:hypothetical protein